MKPVLPLDSQTTALRTAPRLAPGLLGCWLAMQFATASAAGAESAAIKATGRGAQIETTRYRAVIGDGIVQRFYNKLTGEEYLDPEFDPAQCATNLPCGLGTQNGDAAFAAAQTLYRWPWREFSDPPSLRNQHWPDARSKFELRAKTTASAELSYTGLTDGQRRYDDEDYRLTVEVDAATGDLLLTPAGHAPRPGVYGVNLAVSALWRDISVEAPIFDGVRLTGGMAPALWVNKWPDYWDYEFLALNGSRQGAVGIWTQDPELRYKHLFYSTWGGQIALSLGTMNLPPFDQLQDAAGVTWRFQAFDRHWSQAAARFRQWREQNVKFGPRAEWTQGVSLVNNGVNASKLWLDILSDYLGGQHLERTVTFAPVIRARPFDTAHWDNRPYPAFAEEMRAWKAAGPKLMAYLQPMIMWGGGDMTEDDKKIVALAEAARTLSVFQTQAVHLASMDQHHLGHPGWQRWFLDWVKEYIQKDGADGVYHDQTYPTPVDARGRVGGMTSVQGMADYFRKAATENPGAIHGTEHLQAANSVGASLGIGSGILWGTAPTMRGQRIHHGSPVSSALHAPRAVLWGFPHFSDFGMRGDATQFHWGMDLMERRGEIAGLNLQNAFYRGKDIGFEHWVNEVWLDRQRALLFVNHGLRPAFPESWERNVRSYFRGAKGEDFRYEELPWGSRFVQVAGGEKKVLYGRVHGAMHAATAGAIGGWVFYNAHGPAGLHPERYYVLDPGRARPSVFFEPGFVPMPDTARHPTLYESYVEDGSANASLAFLKVRPLPSVGTIIRQDRVLLRCPERPKAVWVNGRPVGFQPLDGGYVIACETPADICAILKEPTPGLGAVRVASLGRIVSSVSLDVFDSSAVSARLVETKAVSQAGKPFGPELSLPGVSLAGVKGYQLHVPFKAPSAGTLEWRAAAGTEVARNGQTVATRELPFQADEMAVVSFSSATPLQVAFHWSEAVAKPR